MSTHLPGFPSFSAFLASFRFDQISHQQPIRVKVSHDLDNIYTFKCMHLGCTQNITALNKTKQIGKYLKGNC